MFSITDIFAGKMVLSKFFAACFWFFILHFGTNALFAEDSLSLSGITQTPGVITMDSVTERIDSTAILPVQQHQSTAQANMTREVTLTELPAHFKSDNITFLLLIILVAFPAVFKYLFPNHFNSLFTAFKNPMLSIRYLKDHIRQNSHSSPVFYLFYGYSASLFLYFAFFAPKESGLVSSSNTVISILTLISIICIAYLLKYVFIQLTGWTFNIAELADNYLFQTLVFNRIISFALIPFTIFLAIGDPVLHSSILLIACVLTGVLLINRYFKSGGILLHFLKYGKLHFFLYLCASEIIPIAILVKIITTW